MKHEWRKQEKAIYLPKQDPVQIEVPAFKYIVLSGFGNPNSREFAACIEALFSTAYAIKMSLKKIEPAPAKYIDWTVYPLEGVWDISEDAKTRYDGRLNKDDLVFDLMIRQPDFVHADLFAEMLALTKRKKPQALLDTIRFETITDGHCVQMLHSGPYDNEPARFARMEAYAATQGLTRLSKTHREIYLSDFRKVPKEKLKTTLRFNVKAKDDQ